MACTQISFNLNSRVKWAQVEWWLEHRHGWLVKPQWAGSVLGRVIRNEYQVLGSTSIPARLDTLVYREPFSWLTSVGTTWNTVIRLGWSRIGSASLARSIRIRFHFRHRTGRIRSVSDHRAGRVWRSRHRSKTPNCLPGARDQVPALFRNAIERRGASVDSNSGAPITQSTFNMLRRMANLLSLLNWWLHRYDNEDDYALFQV